jgi:hypothetical protein
MSFFPLLSAPNCNGWVGLSNFAPNNWEVWFNNSKYINVTWASQDVWKTKSIGVLKPGETTDITSKDLVGIVPQDAFPLLSLTNTARNEESDELPKFDSVQTYFPISRATLGLSSTGASTSYQGELEPFPIQGSLLTFGPLLQFGAEIANYLILLNIESTPLTRYAELEIYDASSCNLIGKETVKNNACNVILLNNFKINPEDLPLFICRNMAFIPLYFSTTLDGEYLSLEHTHPPASLVVHGQRWLAQKSLKKRWFEKAFT